jgi:hypothetical protein
MNLQEARVVSVENYVPSVLLTVEDCHPVIVPNGGLGNVSVTFAEYFGIVTIRAQTMKDSFTPERSTEYFVSTKLQLNIPMEDSSNSRLNLMKLSEYSSTESLICGKAF